MKQEVIALLILGWLVVITIVGYFAFREGVKVFSEIGHKIEQTLQEREK